MAFPQLVIPSQDVKLMINGPWGTPFQLNSAASFNYESSRTVQDIFAVSWEAAIAVVPINKTYSGTLEFQEGEAGLLLEAINATSRGILYASLMEIKNFSLTMTKQYKNLVTPMSEIITWENCVLDRDSGSVNANDAQTIKALSFRGTGITRRTTLLTL